jgi:predicted metal-dependent hydrolase
MAYVDGQRLEVAGSPVRLRVSRRSHVVSLRIDPRHREVIATAPSLKKLRDAAAFAEQRAAWMARQLAALPTPPDLTAVEALRIFGEPHAIERRGLRAQFLPASADAPARLVLPADPHRAPAALARLLKRHALDVLTARTAVYCARLDQPTPPVLVGDAKTRWGSCRPAGPRTAASIRYNWRLALAPFAVADYVAAHECAHLIEANHSPRFWAVVKRLCGDPAPHRAWLKQHGAELHAFGR